MTSQGIGGRASTAQRENPNETIRSARGGGPAHGNRPAHGGRPARSWAPVWAAAAALAGACAPGAGTATGFGTTNTPVNGNAPVVAVMETEAPARADFILRGTVPVPPGTLVPGDPNVPFSVLDYDGTAAPTQVEKVTSYPKWSDGADVVEVLARVKTPPGTAAGTRIQYQVVQNPHKKGNLKVQLDTLLLMSAPGNMLLVAHDVFGNRYTADIFGNGRIEYGKGQANTYRDGDVALQILTHATMTPDDPTQVGKWGGPLKHFLGAHAYHTVWRDEQVVSLDLRIHNAHSGLDKNDPDDDPLGDVYFKDIELWLKPGWKMFQENPDPALGQPYTSQGWTVYPLVAARADGKMHYMPQQAMFNRRLVLAKNGQESVGQAMVDEEGRAFCRSGSSPTGGQLWSWWNPKTARYFPARHRLPELDFLGLSAMLQKDKQNLTSLRNVVATGGTSNFPTSNPVMGWAHPWGAAYGGMTGGSEIYQYDGITTAYAASLDGYRYMQLTHRMYSCRMPDNLFNGDGEPTRLADWLVQGSNGPYIPMAFFQKLIGSNDPFGFNKADKSQVNHVQAQGLQPPYESQLANFMPVDFQHYARYTRTAKALVWLGNDALAKDDIRMHAEIFRLSYTMAANSPSGWAVSGGMLDDSQFVSANPGKGFGFGRGEGWGIDCMNAAYSISDKAWRQEARPWFQNVTDLVSSGQASCSGFVQGIISSKMLGGKYRVRQSIEQGITDNALRGVVESVFRGVDTGRTSQTEYVLQQSYYAMIGPMAWNKSMKGPNNYLAIGPKNPSQGVFCGSIPSDGAANGIDFTQAYSSMAYGYELTGDAQFITKAKEMVGATSMSLEQKLESGYYNWLENKTALLALSQEMGF